MSDSTLQNLASFDQPSPTPDLWGGCLEPDAACEQTLKSELELEALKAELERTGDYRVLRKLRTPVPIDPPALARTGLFIDVETTGLDPARHEIIELAMVPFF